MNLRLIGQVNLYDKIPKKYLLTSTLNFPKKVERQLLKVFIFSQMRKLLHEFYLASVQYELDRDIDSTMECYIMDRKIIQLIIREIVATGEYTLEGIAFHTRIPFDVVLDAACGNNSHLSITIWSRIVELYVQVKPEISRMMIDKLLALQNDILR